MIPGPREGASFATFVEGPTNQAAAAAARQVAERPAGAPNPLLLHGPAGVGKSHLLAAIARAAAERTPPARVEYETLAGLAARAGGQGDGLIPLHECDLLLVDDVETVVGHPDREAVLLELLLGRVPFGRQVVMAAARPPAELGPAGEDLARALADGLTVPLGPPDAGTRLAILRHRAADLTPALHDDVLAAVADLPLASVRELLAAIQRLVAFQAVSPAPLDADQARLLIGGQSGAPSPAERSASPRAPAEPPPPAPALAVGEDEFSSFLSEVVASVTHQVDRWRAQVGEAILQFGGEGFRTGRLEALLEQESPPGPAEALEQFRRDVAQLRALEAEAASIAPEFAGAAAFRDPDAIADAVAAVTEARLQRDPLPAPSLEFRFDRFAEGPGNRQAVHAVRQAGQQPGGRFNPLVIIGASGTGKSHLLHGLGNLLVAAAPGPVACQPAPAFAADVARAAAAGRLDDWRSRYRQAGALMLDDFHLLRGQPAAQDHFLALLIHLVESGRQVVVTVSAPLAALSGLDPRILTRLEAGLVVELPRPDREVRLAVIKQMLSGTPAAGDAALADWLAARPADSVRAVQGAVHRLLSAAEAQGVAPSPSLAREVLDHRDGASRRPGPAGVTGPVHGVAQSPEKVVLVWPRVAERLIEELG